MVRAATGKVKKAIVMDCDNTLWKGVLGEDGFDGIEMSINTKDGLIFSEVQAQLLTLHQKGVIIGICSKNNQKDVNVVLLNHPDMQLRDRHITIKKLTGLTKLLILKK